MLSEKKLKRLDIDGLRGVAILLVLLFHAFPSRITGGFIGVDIFFVISGYLITNNILNQLTNKNFSYITFINNRLLRLLPSLLLIGQSASCASSHLLLYQLL